MPSTLRILLAALSGLAGLGAIYLILRPGSQPLERALELGAVTLLLTATLLNSVLEAKPRLKEASVEPRPPGAGEPDPAQEGDDPIQGEVGRILALLRSHAEANANFSNVLDKANEDLHESLKAEQVRTIISYLMVENEKMRGRTANLQVNLETSQRQIERLKTTLAAAEEQGMTDPLTGLRNRRSFDVVLAAQVAAARNAAQPLSLVIADIDHFKSINDRYGHPAGDSVLKWFAKTLSSNVKGRDTVARYGGEEFAIIMPQTTAENAANIAGQIRGQLGAQFWQKPGAPNTMLRVTASFGVAQLQPGEGTSGLIARADAKLYEAKAGGRNRVSA